MKKLFWIFGLTFLPYLGLLIFVHPAADDFTFSGGVINSGYWQTQYKIYTEWFGRYFSTLLVTLNPVAIHRFDLYKLYPVLVFFSTGLGLYYFVDSLVHSFSRREKIFATVAVFSVFISRMPSVVEGFYWMPGSTNYTLSLPVFFFALGFILKKLSLHLDNQRYLRQKFSVGHHLLLFLCSFVICGFNETIMFLWVLALSYLIFRERVEEKSWNRDLIYVLLGALIWSAVVALSPGNRIRAAHFSGNFLLFTAIGKSLFFGAWHFFRFLGPASITGGLLFGLWVSHSRDRFNPALKERKNLKYIAGALFLVLVGSLFPAYVSMDGIPPRRVLNMVCLFHNLLILVLVISWALRSDFFLRLFAKKWLSARSVTVFFVLFLFAVGNHRKATVDLFVKAPDYDRALKDRYLKMKENPGGDILVPALVDPPRSICFDDITEDPKDWRNTSYAAYFGVNSITKYEGGK